MIWAMHGLTFSSACAICRDLRMRRCGRHGRRWVGNAWVWLISAVVHELSSIFSILLCREVLHLRRIQEHTSLCIAAPRDTGVSAS
jgi:hypothetical protein